jgi:hypothetical protein
MTAAIARTGRGQRSSDISETDRHRLGRSVSTQPTCLKPLDSHDLPEKITRRFPLEFTYLPAPPESSDAQLVFRNNA